MAAVLFHLEFDYSILLMGDQRLMQVPDHLFEKVVFLLQVANASSEDGVTEPRLDSPTLFRGHGLRTDQGRCSSANSPNGEYPEILGSRPTSENLGLFGSCRLT